MKDCSELPTRTFITNLQLWILRMSERCLLFLLCSRWLSDRPLKNGREMSKQEDCQVYGCIGVVSQRAFCKRIGASKSDLVLPARRSILIATAVQSESLELVVSRLLVSNKSFFFPAIFPDFKCRVPCIWY